MDQEDHDKYLTGAEFTLYQVVDDQDPAAEEIEVNGQKLWLKVIREKITSGTLEGVPGGALTELLDPVPIICGRPRRLLTMKTISMRSARSGPAPSW